MITNYLPVIDRSYTPEQIEAARKKASERLASEIGMCTAACQVCHGLGWVRDGYGKLMLCPNVDRLRVFPERYGMTRQEAEAARWPKGAKIQPVIKLVKDVIQRGYGWVYVFGPFGIGKTFLLRAAVAGLLLSGKDAAYTRMAEIVDHLRDGFDAERGEQGETERLRWWAELPVLAIDEFDRVRKTEYADERRFVLMDRRYEAAIRQRSVTLIASNSGPAELPGYLRDRIEDGRFVVVELNGTSQRPIQRYE